MILDDVLPEVRDYTHPERTEIREQFIQQVLHQRKSLVMKEFDSYFGEDIKEFKEEIEKMDKQLTRQIKEM